MGDVTAEAKRSFEERYAVDAARGESVETALDSNGVLHVRVRKIAEGYAPEIPIQIRFTAE